VPPLDLVAAQLGRRRRRDRGSHCRRDLRRLLRQSRRLGQRVWLPRRASGRLTPAHRRLAAPFTPTEPAQGNAEGLRGCVGHAFPRTCGRMASADTSEGCQPSHTETRVGSREPGPWLPFWGDRRTTDGTGTIGNGHQGRRTDRTPSDSLRGDQGEPVRGFVCGGTVNPRGTIARQWNLRVAPERLVLQRFDEEARRPVS
jgi:hypothetical protein